MRRDPPCPRESSPFFVCRSYLIDFLKGTLTVTLVTLHLRRLVKPVIVTTHIGERRPRPPPVWVVVKGLPPGSFFVDIERTRGFVLVHLLDARDPEGFRRRQAEFYRRYQSRVFPDTPRRRSECTKSFFTPRSSG